MDDLVVRLRDEADGCTRWANGPGDRYPAHSHDYEKVLYCTEGSLTFFMEPAGRRVELQPGDRLVVPPGVSHSAVVGPHGCSCIEGRGRKMAAT